QDLRSAVHADQLRQHLDDTTGADRPGHVDGKALTGELVDDGQTLDLLAVGAGVEDEVVGPDLPGARRRLGPRSAVGDALAASLPRHLQTGFAPQPPGPVDTHLVSLTFEKDMDAAVAVTRIL